MGPRLFSRGKPRRCSGLRECHKLQWGRGFSAAERICTFQGSALPAWLQWGRGFSAAESYAAHPALLPPMRFNGAAAFQPRKVVVEPCPSIHPISLQWGRGFSAAESYGLHVWLQVTRLASMGPRLFSRGKDHKSCNISSHNTASMGPRLFSRGKPKRAVTTKHTRSSASMGPRLFSRGKLT